MPDQPVPDGTITIRLVSHGERTITDVSRARFQAARDAGQLDEYLDTWASNIDEDTIVVLDDGTVLDLWKGNPPPRTSLVSGSSVTEALKQIITAAAADLGPATVQTIADALVTACRQENLVALPLDEADAIHTRGIEQAVAAAAHTGTRHHCCPASTGTEPATVSDACDISTNQEG